MYTRKQCLRYSTDRLRGEYPLDPFAEKLAALNFSAIKKAAERFFVKRSATKKKLQIMVTINYSI